MIQQFMIDGKEYHVQVMDLTRYFEVKDSINPVTTQDGGIYRKPIGTYYNYSMTVREKDGDRAAFDAFWEAMSSPVESHVCVFPYNQETIAQRMYVKTGSQAIRRLYAGGAEWKDITIQYIANSPKVLA